MTRLYELVLELYPRRIREAHGAEIRLAFAAMLSDPTIRRRHLIAGLVGDIWHGLRGGLAAGIVIGLAVLATWFAGRSHHVPGIHSASGLVIIGLLLTLAGFIGARRSGSTAGGLWTGLVAAAMSSLTVPGDAALFHIWISDQWSFTWTMVIAAGVVMTIVAVGSLAAGFPTHQRRVRRSTRAFIAAWTQPT